MASTASILLHPMPVLAMFLILTSKPDAAMGCYTSIISFGDSLADTGNFAISISNNMSSPLGRAGRLPCGVTYFHRDSGRLSDGRLVIDFIECKKIFGRSLIFVGEIGGNDYNFTILQGRNLSEIQTFVLKIIRAISSTIHVLIKLGARTLVAPGAILIGCSSAYLTVSSSPSNPKGGGSHPTTRCIKWANELMECHNRKLLNEVDKIRRQYPHVTIICAYFYGAIMNIFHSL